MKQKRWFVVLSFMMVLIVLTVGTVGCSSGSNSGERTIRLGVNGDEVELWTLVQKKLDEQYDKKELKQKITLKIVKFNDYVQPNNALQAGDIDLNAFQTITYMNQFKRDHKLDIVAIGTTAIAPMGIYSKKFTNVNDIPEGSTITIPNDVTNSIRALKLLQSAKLIKLKDGFSITGGIEQIADNPKKLIIEPVTAGHTARTLEDVAAAVINNGVAVQAELDPAKDPIVKEAVDDPAAHPYINVIAARTKDKDDPDLVKIVEAVQSQEVQEYRLKRDKGAVLPVVIPIEEIQDL